MTDVASTALEELVSLAKDYDTKRRQLDELARDVDAQALRRHLLALSERATDRFRGAQQALFRHLVEEAPPGPETLEAARAMCRSFDEMVLLFHKLMDQAAASS